jgi:hypothetical protein
MSVHKKLMQARIQLQGTKLSKSGKNKFAGYSYFELGDFLPTIQDIFHQIGLCGFVSFGKDLATLTITDVDGGGEILITSPMAEANLKGTHPIQNLGAVETYNRRYLWMAAMEIVEHDILDASKPLEEKQAPIITPNQGAGQEVWMSAWLKTSTNGKKFMSFSFKPKDQQAAKPVAKSAPALELDDDMPF